MLAVTPNRREELAAMVLELQINRAALYGLTNWFSVFVFTGGRVPTAEWDLVATNSYLSTPRRPIASRFQNWSAIAAWCKRSAIWTRRQRGRGR